MPTTSESPLNKEDPEKEKFIRNWPTFFYRKFMFFFIFKSLGASMFFCKLNPPQKTHKKKRNQQKQQ